MQVQLGGISTVHSTRLSHGQVGENGCRFTEVGDTRPANGRNDDPSLYFPVESETPTSWKILVLYQQCAGFGRRANHDKPRTMVCQHIADPHNKDRCQITTTRNFSIGAASDDTGSGDVLDCKLHGGENHSVLGQTL